MKSGSKKQVTLSKFFSSSSTSSKSSGSSQTKFETKGTKTENKKRQQSQSSSEAGGPKEKKSRCEDEDQGTKSSQNHEIVISNITDRSDRLKQFDYNIEEVTACDKEDGRREFVSQDCYTIDFSQSSEGGENEKVPIDEDGEVISKSSGSQEDKTSSSSVKKSLSQFQTEKNVKKSAIKYTPLEQQVVQIKNNYPDTLLFVECGYKYRFFGEDAEIAAKVLNIYCHMDHNFMTASIPVHRLFVHVRRLVAAGYKVGVVKQTETAHLKAASDNRSAPFTRELTSIYTKSTLIGEDVDPIFNVDETNAESLSGLKLNHYLMCLCESPKESPSKSREIGLVCVDPATGDVIYDNFQDGDSFSELETRLLHLEPVEILVPENVSLQLLRIVTDTAAVSLRNDDRVRVEKIKSKDIPSPKDTTSQISKFYEKDAEHLQTVLNLPKSVLLCLNILISHLKVFGLDGILAMTSNFNQFTPRSKYMHLSAQCLVNLEVFHNSCDGSPRGSLFSVLNHTYTKFGSRLLKRWVAQPLLDNSEICHRVEAVEEVNSGRMPDLKKTREMLSKLPDLERGLCSIFYKKSSPSDFYNVTNSLEKLRKHFETLRTNAATTKSSFMLSLINEIPDLLEGVGLFCKSINETAARADDKANLFVDESQFPSISNKKKEMAKVVEDIRDHRKEIRKQLNQPGLDYVTINQVEFLIPVKNSLLKTVPSSWTTINSTKQVTRFHSPLIVKNYQRLNELREELVAAVVKAWQGFLEEFSSNYIRYRKAVGCIASLDCILSLAKVSSQDTFCRPEISSDTVEIYIDQGRHPILDSLKEDCQQIMPNDTNLTVDGFRVMVISGPNMGGKSSYIRQVALIVILAQIGCYIPAQSARLGIVDGIYTRMGASDKIFQGQSTFMVELQEASEIMSHATPRSLVILDELGRGTSTHDGVAIAHATLKHFITKTKSLVLFVTHFPTMLEFHKIFPDCVYNCHMAFFLEQSEDSDNPDVVTFLYQLTEGAAEKSYGLNVARLAEISPPIIQAASKKAQEMEDNITSRIATRENFTKFWTSEEKNLMQNISSYCKKTNTI